MDVSSLSPWRLERSAHIDHLSLIQINRQSKLLLRVNNGSPAWASECPFLGVKQTSISGGWMSAFSQKATFMRAAAPSSTDVSRPRGVLNKLGF
jgi:hypothetical protein